MPIRRAHKKSRFGCRECKRRHIKCDEARPTCTNCFATERNCSYFTSVPAASSNIAVSAASPASNSTATLGIPAKASVTSNAASTISFGDAAVPVAFSPAQDGVSCHPLNMRHMELLSHFILETCEELGGDDHFDRTFLRLMMPAALSTPYLMYQLLAFSALHLSHLRPAQRLSYHEEATSLQTQALAVFNSSSMEITSETCVPMLMFASFVGIQALCEAVILSETDTNSFMDRFITYLDLHRGVRVVTSRSWALLMQSNISPYLERVRCSLDAASHQARERSAAVTDRLYCLLDDSDLGEIQAHACREAVSRLQHVLQSGLLASDSNKTRPQAAGLIWAWPSHLSLEFTHLLMKRTPEALVILSYYGALLHQRRHMWFVTNAGRQLIEAITKYLGTYWKQWLDWPNEMLEADT